MSSPRFSVLSRLKSFGHAFDGLWFMLRTQHNAWLHLVVTMAVILTASFLNVEAGDWRWLIAAMALVWTAEAFNTAVEYICDLVSPDRNEAVKRAKDIAAGAVLVCAAAAATIGVITLWPYVSAFIKVMNGPVYL